MATMTADAQTKAEVFAEELTKIVMKVSRKMSKEEREERLNKLNERLSAGSAPKHV